jgi:hypothetical protein
VGVVLVVGYVGAVIVDNATMDGGGGSGSSNTLSQAFCNDLEAGYTPFQILRESVADGTYSPREAADLAYGWAAISCREQLRSNESLRVYLEKTTARRGPSTSGTALLPSVIPYSLTPRRST